MNFGSTLHALKGGMSVARSGWNGKGMYIYLVPENRYAPTTAAGAAIAQRHQDYKVPYRAYIAMKTVDEDVVPWVASQTDLLADDWELV